MLGFVHGERIECPYHGWTYDASGQCVARPGEPRPFCDRIKIKGYPVQEYLGLVFVYLGEGEAPPLPRLADLKTTTSTFAELPPKSGRAAILICSRMQRTSCTRNTCTGTSATKHPAISTGAKATGA